jgi:hypothetical protein
MTSIYLSSYCFNALPLFHLQSQTSSTNSARRMLMFTYYLPSTVCSYYFTNTPYYLTMHFTML